MSSAFIQLEPLTADAFRPFGDVIEQDSERALEINDGFTEKHPDLGKLLSLEGQNFSAHIYRSQKMSYPFKLEKLECHELGSQMFFPLHSDPFPVVVAAAGLAPEASDVRAFVTNGTQGVVLSPGTWHHHQLSFREGSNYLVVERAQAGTDCLVHQLNRYLQLDTIFPN